MDILNAVQLLRAAPPTMREYELWITVGLMLGMLAAYALWLVARGRREDWRVAQINEPRLARERMGQAQRILRLLRPYGVRPCDVRPLRLEVEVIRLKMHVFLRAQALSPSPDTWLRSYLVRPIARAIARARAVSALTTREVDILGDNFSCTLKREPTELWRLLAFACQSRGKTELLAEIHALTQFTGELAGLERGDTEGRATEAEIARCLAHHKKYVDPTVNARASVV